ncbi:MAG TPA: sugar ABC transporter permease [Roseiflexaceae bacterium]|nr:sugar ABC transporter permease [Roseiflexaceae bacterium]
MQSTPSINRPAVKQPGFFGGLTANTVQGMQRRKVLLAYLFLLPTIVGIMVFTAGPIISSLGLSFYSWNVITPAEFVGLENYRRLIGDPTVQVSFLNTAKFVVLAVTLQLSLALFLAMAVQQKMPTWLRYFFRSAFFLPVLTSAASISIVLAYMFHREFGVINYYLGIIGIEPIPWLNSARWALITVVLTYVWQGLGFTFIVFTGGLNNIPTDILEAADVDGARGWRRLWHITLPLLSPTILFAAVIGVINALQVFAEPYVLTKGGPGDASRTVVLTIYETAFKNLELGYGSAIAMILFIVIMLVTAAQFWLSKRAVFYQ